MIKIFTKTRQTLLEENKTTKYFKYAIGEIVLVVIGILIALQINNWNENEIKGKKEKNLINQINFDLQNNKKELIEFRKRLKINKNGIDSLIVRLQTKNNDAMLPIHLSFTIRKVYFNNASSGYKIMQNGMAQLISNTTILKKILNLYDNDFNKISKREVLMHRQIDDFQKDFINKYFKRSPHEMQITLNKFDKIGSYLFKPIDFIAIADNVEFINRLYQLKQTIKLRLVYSKQTLTTLNEVLLEIQ